MIILLLRRNRVNTFSPTGCVSLRCPEHWILLYLLYKNTQVCLSIIEPSSIYVCILCVSVSDCVLNEDIHNLVSQHSFSFHNFSPSYDPWNLYSYAKTLIPLCLGFLEQHPKFVITVSTEVGVIWDLQVWNPWWFSVLQVSHFSLFFFSR